MLDLNFDPCAPTAVTETPAVESPAIVATAPDTAPSTATPLLPPPTAPGALSTGAPVTSVSVAPDDLSVFLPPVSAVQPAPASTQTTGALGSLEVDQWDDFQSSVVAPAATTVTPAAISSPPPADAANNTAPVTASTEVFDPLLIPEKPPAPELFSATELGTLAGTSGNDNLISFGNNDEFDPVAPMKEPLKVSAPAPEPVAPQVAAAEVAASPPPVLEFAPDDLLGIGTPMPVTKSQEIVEDVNGVSVPVEDIEKKVIYVYHKGEKNVVAWYADTAASDIKEAILCACDAIMDGGFVLREVEFTGEDEESAEPKEDGTVYEYEQFDQLGHEQTYILEAAKEREDLKKITGDRWRRMKVMIEPLLHVEAQKAIERMRRGSNLLKHTHYGFPHLRQFQLSDDRKRLVWYSGAKRKEDSVVQLDEVVEIRLGQTTPVFLHYRLPMLEHLSFSLVYGANGSKTLDLTCKDEFEFDHWVTGLKAIFYHFKNRQISKEQLLGHSKRFRKALDKNNVGIKLTKLPEVKEKGHVGLDDCIEIVTHTPAQLDTKMERLRERLRTMSQQVARLDHHSNAEMEVDFALLTGQGPAYASVFVQDEDAQDEEMEIRRMHELVEQTTQVLQQARNELVALNQKTSESTGSGDAAKAKKKESAACKHVDQLLWKAEVDLENVEDMYLRHVDNQKDTATPFSVSMADMNQRLTRMSSDAADMFSSKVDEMKRWFG